MKHLILILCLGLFIPDSIAQVTQTREYESCVAAAIGSDQVEIPRLISCMWGIRSKALGKTQMKGLTAGRLIEIVGERWSNNEWMYEVRTQIGYDAFDRLDIEEFYVWDGSSWGEPTGRTMYSYDSESRLEAMILQDWVLSTNTWIDVTRIVLEYDQDGKIVSLVFEYWDSQWIPLERVVLVWGETTLESMRADGWDETSNEWQPGTDVEFVFVGDDATTTFRYWDDSSQEWVPSERVTFYDATVEFGIDFVGGLTVVYVVPDFLSEEWDESTMSWENDARQASTLDNEGRPVDQFIELWDVNEERWVPDGMIVIEYDGDDLSMITDQYWSDGTESWVNERRLSFIYVPRTAVVSFPTEASFVLRNYPNPFVEVTTITFSTISPGWVSLRVYDVLGRELETLTHRVYVAGRHTTEFDGSNLPPGIYVYRLETDTVDVSRTMVKAN